MAGWRAALRREALTSPSHLPPPSVGAALLSGASRPGWHNRDVLLQALTGGST
jgi:hypothetical protein